MRSSSHGRVARHEAYQAAELPIERRQKLELVLRAMSRGGGSSVPHREHAMHGATWTESEKKIARRVFEAALQRELADVMAEFKARAANAKTPEDMWAVQEYLASTRREIDSKYDYRYSQLDLVLGRLLREKRIDEHELKGLAEEKLVSMRRVASF
jgi:hypothetical protein